MNFMRWGQSSGPSVVMENVCTPLWERGFLGMEDNGSLPQSVGCNQLSNGWHLTLAMNDQFEP